MKSLREVLGPWLEARQVDLQWGDLLEEVGREDRPLANPWESSRMTKRISEEFQD
jgi:hypothetical protein